MGTSLFLLHLLLFNTYFILSASSPHKPLLFPLTHGLSTTQFTTPHHLLKSTSTSSAARFHRHHHHHHHHHRRQVSLPLSSGSDYILSFTIGSSSSAVSLYLDTGSDLVWFPCAPFTCILCESKPTSPTPPANISSASLVSCSSAACSAAHSSTSSSDLCAISRCPLDSIEIGECASFPCPPFYYAYADGSLIARLYHDTLSLPISSNSFAIRNFTFGCAHTTLAEPIGVAGFGRGTLSVPAQLATFSPQLGNSFSYCLISHSFDADRIRRPSPLILGRYVEEKEKRAGAGEEIGEFAYTQMLENPKHPYFYSVSLEGISVGKRYIPAPEILKRVDKKGGGGMVVDSGTTFTMLPSVFYNSVVAELDHRVGRFHERADRVESETGMGPCYYYNQTIKVPALVLHFAGNRSSVALPRRNYFYEFVDVGDGKGKKRNVGCLMLMNGGDEEELSGGPGATLGNYQQQGFEVHYDLVKGRVGFAKRKCASLWESLNQG